MSTPAKNTVLNTLIAEIALGYHSDDELCSLYDISPEKLAYVKNQPLVQKAVTQARREVVENGETFRIMARRLSTSVLEELGAMAFDPALEPSDKLKVIEMLARFAGLDRPSETAGVNITINTNIGQDEAAPSRGEYTIKLDG